MKFIADTTKDYAIILDDKNLPVAGTTLGNFNQVIGSANSSFDSGLMPQEKSGIISIRSYKTRIQIAYQQAPAAALIKWGEYENDSNVKVYNLAHPYKIWIADFDENQLVGLRHFFSPEPIYTLDDPLFHTTYPNTNCKGYNGTSIGWVCLYRSGNIKLSSIQEMVMYAWERESGLHEPYNNSNMKETDGPRFYFNNGIDIYNNPIKWQEKTNQEGWDWICDPKMLLPILVSDSDEVNTYHMSGGVPYTFGMAISDPYYPYYPSKLSDLQKRFYARGWGNLSMADENFSPQILSKLCAITLPTNFNLDLLVSEFDVTPITPSNYEIYNDIAATSFSELILNSKNVCLFCQEYSQDMIYIMPYFMTYASRSGYQSFPMSKMFPYSIGRALPFGQKENVHFYGCNNCLRKNYFKKFEVATEIERNNYGFKKNTENGMIAGCMTHRGRELVRINPKTSSKLNLPASGIEILSKYKIWASYVTDVVNSISSVPNTHTVTCLSCSSIYEYELMDSGPKFPENTIGIIYSVIYANFFIPRESVHCSNCLDAGKIYKISSHFKSDFRSDPKFTEHVDQIVNGPKSNIQPISEMMWLFKSNSDSPINSLVLNDMTFSTETNKYPLIDLEENKLYQNVLFRYDRIEDDYCQIASFEEIEAMNDPTYSFGYENFEDEYGNSSAYVLTVFIGGFWEIFIDTLENLQTVEVCQCQIPLEQQRFCVSGPIKGAKGIVCIGCTSRDETGTSVYFPIVDHSNTLSPSDLF